MRQRFDFSEHDEALFRGRLRKSGFVHTLAADNFDISAGSPPVLVIDPGGSARDIRLPALTDEQNKNLQFIIINSADAAEALTVKNSDESATIAVIAEDNAGIFWNDGTSWYGFVLAGDGTAAYAATATSDGLTTGLIPITAEFVSVTSAAAGNIITLPSGAAGNIGKVIKGWVGANGCEIRTPAASGATINGVDSDGTNEAAIPATTLFTCTLVAADTWILEAVTELGAVITAIVPDAA